MPKKEFFSPTFRSNKKVFLFFPGQLLIQSNLIVKIIESKFYGSVDCVLKLTQCNH